MNITLSEPPLVVDPTLCLGCHHLPLCWDHRDAFSLLTHREFILQHQLKPQQSADLPGLEQSHIINRPVFVANCCAGFLLSSFQFLQRELGKMRQSRLLESSWTDGSSGLSGA